MARIWLNLPRIHNKDETIAANQHLQDMSVLVNRDSKIIVQGFTGGEGTFHTRPND